MQKRDVLWWLLMFGMACDTLILLNLNIAIVSMVSTYDRNKPNETKAIVCPNTTLFLRNFEENSEQTPYNYYKKEVYDWTEAEQNMILSGSGWLSYFAVLLGGVMAHKFGSKRVVGFTEFIAAVMSSLIPICADYGPITLSWIRAVQGLLSMIAAPAGVFTIIGNWSPPQERGKFGSTFMVGLSVGLTLGTFCFGYIAEYIHWKYVFHLTSVCGTVWAIFWYKLVYDSPRQHPTISCEEKDYVEKNLKPAQSATTRVSVPWKSIITSLPVIICIWASNSGIWAFVMMNTYIPTYLKSIYGLNSNEIGILTSVPLFLGGVMGWLIGYCSDLSIKNKLLNITQIRKLGAFFGCVVASIPMLIISFTKCNINVIISCILTCSVLRTFGNFGPALAIMDISPKFCGILEGFSGTSATIQAFLFSMTINYFTTILDIEELWKFVFLYTALYAIITNIVFLIFGTAELQKWNFEDSDEVSKEEESIGLNIL